MPALIYLVKKKNKSATIPGDRLARKLQIALVSEFTAKFEKKKYCTAIIFYFIRSFNKLTQDKISSLYVFNLVTIKSSK